jgi:hypothetical protein
MDLILKPIADFIEFVKIEKLHNPDYLTPKTIFTAFIPFFVIILYFVVGSFVVRFIVSLLPKKKCKICGREANDILSADSSHQLGVFCRNHLIQEYSKLFLSSYFNKVIVEFQPKAAGVWVYSYYPISELENFGWEKKSREVVENLLLTINGQKCRECSNSSTTLFVSKEAAPWSKYSSEPSLEFAKTGEYLCNEHALEKIKPGIQSNKRHFDDGLWLPYKEAGFQVGTEL